ncbi:MAG: hypothetical protein ACTS7D_00995 [Candidatus Hodgkinia cicadicola]
MSSSMNVKRDSQTAQLRSCWNESEAMLTQYVEVNWAPHLKQLNTFNIIIIKSHIYLFNIWLVNLLAP